jgi:hypothetical protein
MTDELLEGSSVSEIRGIATRALAGGDDCRQWLNLKVGGGRSREQDRGS